MPYHVSCFKGIEDPEKDDDGLINEPLQIISEVSELEESDDAEVLFEPPPMFARYGISRHYLFAKL